MPNAFVPTVFFKRGCPFCLKLRLFLLEAGLIDQVALIEPSTQEEQNQLASELTNRIGKVSFPAAEIAPGQFLSESEILVAHFAELSETKPEQLPTYQAYLGGVFLHIQQLYRDNIELRTQIEARSRV
jgi:glutathione S-transferase